MGNCCGSQDDGYDDMDQPSAESRRQAAAEAAERRAQTQGSRGIQDPSRVQRMQERSLEVERLEREAAKTGDTGPTLRWQAS